MQPTELPEHHLFPSTIMQFPDCFSFATSILPAYNLNGFPNPLFQFHVEHQLQEGNLKSTSFSNNSTSDEADEQQQSIINERKQRRMISNRESARRSRIRKQRHMDQLWSQVVCLRNENQQLRDELNRVSENHEQVLQENAQLKEEASEFRQVLTDIQLNSPYSASYAQLHDLVCIK